MYAHIARLSYFGKDILNPKKTNLRLEDFSVHSKHIKNQAMYRIFHNQDEIGYMRIKPANGQIGIIRLDVPYRGRDLGRQLVALAYKDIVTEGSATHLWAVSRRGHPFWTNVPGMVWRDPPVHHSVTGYGYSVELANPYFMEWLTPEQ